jgi:hypothetical protein
LQELELFVDQTMPSTVTLHLPYRYHLHVYERLPFAKQFACSDVQEAPVQIAGLTGMFSIDMDTLSIEQDSIPDGGRSGIFEPEHGEVELPLANAVH